MCEGADWMNERHWWSFSLNTANLYSFSATALKSTIQEDSGSNDFEREKDKEKEDSKT